MRAITPRNTRLFWTLEGVDLLEVLVCFIFYSHAATSRASGPKVAMCAALDPEKTPTHQKTCLYVRAKSRARRSG